MELTTGQFSDSYFPVVDGVSVTIRNYLRELNRTLGPAFAVVPGTHSSPNSAGSETYRFFSLPLIRRSPYRVGFPNLDVSLHRALRGLCFDLVHAHSPFLAGRLALKLARQRGIPVVATFHSKYRDKIKNALPSFSLTDRILVDPVITRIVEFYAAVDQVWAPTEAAVETLREYGYRGAVEIVRHGIDFDCTADRNDLRHRGEAHLAVDPKDFLFLYVGDHAWEKNLAFMLRSLSLLRGSGYRFKLALVGEGYAARSLRSMASRLGLDGTAGFVGVLRDREALSACYARADCFLFPSLYDTCGLVVREAAAFSVPSVVIRWSAAAEEIVDGFNGFTAEHSVRSYAAKLAVLMEHPEMLRRAGEGARRTLCTSWRDVVEGVRERYLQLVASSPVMLRGSAAHQSSIEKKGAL
jgi:glycosyltransferase involved in cell wall biosynthesis